MKYDRDKVRKAVAAYVYFLLDNAPKDGTDAVAFDSKRKALHRAIFAELTKNPENFEDNYISEGLGNPTWKDGFGNEENYIDFHTDRLIDTFHNNVAQYGGGIEIDWERKERIDWVIEHNKKRINSRIKEVDKVMERAVKGLDDWNKDHPNSKHLYTWDVGINTHDWNGLRSAINSNWNKMEALARMPREAYTKMLVNAYLHTPLRAIDSLIIELQAIAFQAERTKYYTYERKGTNQ